MYYVVENCEDWDVRLSYEVSEVCVNGTWTAIRPSSSGITSVICKQLDLSMYGMYVCFSPSSYNEESIFIVRIASV